MRLRHSLPIVLLAALGAGLAGCAGGARRAAAPGAVALPVDGAARAPAELTARVRSALPDCAVDTPGDAVRATVPARRVFEADSVALRADAGATLARLVRVLRSCRGCAVEVVGHTDAIGPAAVNLLYSLQRAEALAAWLRTAGVPAARLRARGAGESEPVAGEATPADREANRRIEIIIRP